MKEFNYTFSEGLKKGLRQYSNNPINSEALVRLLNLKINETGLIPVSYIKKVANDISISWPFPLVFKGIEYCIVAENDTVYNVPISSIIEDMNVATEDPILDEIDASILDELSSAITWSGVATLDGLSSGTYWDFADFGAFFILTNGNVIVFVDHVTDPDSPNIGYMASSATFPRCGTYCNYKGQVIGGNVKTSWYDCDESSVIWSQIGSANFTPYGASDSGFKVSNENSGEVYKVFRLGDSVAVYCENCVYSMIPVDVKFGIDLVIKVGIPSIKAMAGSYKEHVFVDNLDRLWRWKAGERPVKLDYSEHISTLTSSNIKITLDEGNNEYYISDGVKGYILTDYGLSETFYLPTSLFTLGDSLYGIYTNSDTAGFVVETDIIDFGLRGSKTIVALEFGISYTPDYILDEEGEEVTDQDGGSFMSVIQAQIGYKTDIKGSFSYSPVKLVNPNGVVYPRVTADEFKIRVYSSSHEDVRLDYINARINLTDKRSVRGRINVA